MDIIIYLIIGVAALAVGVIATVVVQKAFAKSRAKAIIDEATSEAENIKKTKILEVREEELKIKAPATPKWDTSKRQEPHLNAN